ncbi:MAG: AraC family transcriptional regulator [Lachnospiraceae bacterium]|nr:AraC family transcriptional regulator [Lachnospiraceae bacterium]
MAEFRELSTSFSDSEALLESSYEAIRFSDETFPFYIISDMTTSALPPPSSVPIFSWHEQLEIIYVQEGSLICVSDFRRRRCPAGEVAVFNPCEAHAIEPDGCADARYHCLMIDTKLCGGRDDIILQKYMEPLISHRIRFQTVMEDEGGKAQAREILDELIGAYRDGGEGFELAVKGNLLRLLALFFRSPEKAERKSSSQENVLPALRYIADHYAEDIPLSSLASACCMNSSYFCRRFREVTGRTAVTYVNEYRLTKAQALLLTTSDTVSGIAAAVGFSDPGYFTRLFRKFYGVPPGTLRKQT